MYQSSVESGIGSSIDITKGMIELNWLGRWIGIGLYGGFERLAANDPFSWLAVETGATNGKQNGVVKQKSNASLPALPVPISSPLSTYKRHKSPAKFHPFTSQSDINPISFDLNSVLCISIKLVEQFS